MIAHLRTMDHCRVSLRASENKSRGLHFQHARSFLIVSGWQEVT